MVDHEGYMDAYHVAIDWRRAKFFIGHPTVPPETIEPPLNMPQHACFLPRACISNVIAIRDWLHSNPLAGSFRLLGRFAQLTSVFQGLVVCFDNVFDLRRFQAQWTSLVIA
jgi:hypothetical protein